MLHSYNCSSKAHALPKKADHQACMQKANTLERLWWEFYLKISFKMEKESLVFNFFNVQEVHTAGQVNHELVFTEIAKHSFHKPTKLLKVVARFKGTEFLQPCWEHHWDQLWSNILWTGWSVTEGRHPPSCHYNKPTETMKIRSKCSSEQYFCRQQQQKWLSNNNTGTCKWIIYEQWFLHYSPWI